ncbi:hypothetical protein N0V85_008929 [Neurospora sp. IMI 360204]|nr:hypothetical protein N0V85_008929 [Neurospora sp. IMI 360204]
MARRTRGLKPGPRHLLFRHARRLLRAREGDPLPSGIPPGCEALRSFYVPGLEAGPHSITVSQTVYPTPPPGQPPPVTTPYVTTQTFDVIDPQFSLPDKAIHSTYPPQGQQEAAKTLPHVLFNDVTFPWERIGAPSEENSPPADFDRSRTPWLAVFVFTQDELKLDPNFLPGGSSNLFAGVDPSVIVKMSSTFSINLPVSEIANLDKTKVARATAEPDFFIDPKATTDLIFLKPELFTGLFLARDKATGLPTDKWKNGASVYQHRFLAHRRDINTQGMAIAGSTSEEDDTGSFGAIFSNRSGPYNITSPTAIFVHLVSIEGVEKMSPWPPLDHVRFVVLPSLYSWSYICLPPDVPNVLDEFENLGNTLELLRPVFSKGDDPKLPPASDPVGNRIRERLGNGYSLSRYRTQTGESTACFTRGPFVPSDVQNLPDWWPATSMAGTDLQILDQELGIMDISYSVAWQVGRTMAIADQSFTTALYRVRQQILNRASSEAHAAAVNSAIPNGFKTRPDLIRSLDRALEGLQRLKLEPADDAADFMRRRWRHEPMEPLDLSYHGPVHIDMTWHRL